MSPCTLDVVLVTFDDATERAGGYDYHLHDRPHGSNDDGAYPDPDSSYTLREFERLFSGGYDSLQDSALVGNTVKVAKGNHTLPEVFGSVRAYFDEISNGDFELRVRMINPADSQGYPRWVELPQTKEHYAEIDRGDEHRHDLFWDDAQRAAQDSVNLWYPDTTAYDIPDNSYGRERRLRHKVLYLYSGATYSERSPVGLLHPHVDQTTQSQAPSARWIGYRYVMGERQGWGDDRDGHSVDEFAGIGMHAHEIGHLLGFDHPDGGWSGRNEYTSQTTGDVVDVENNVTVEFTRANLSGWGSMQSGAHGPEIVGDDGYHSPYRSCPNPFNPFFRMDLGWNTRENITTTTLKKRIEPGPDHFYVVRGANHQHYILDFRTASGFGQYTGWHRFTQSPGLLIWRRPIVPYSRNALLIPADGRSIFDARHRPVLAEPTSVSSSYTYVWQDRLSDPFGAVEQRGPLGSLPGREHRPTVRHATDATHLQHATYSTTLETTADANTDPRPSRLAFRNIRIHRGASGGDYAEVDIYHNYWAGELDRNTTWSGIVYVGGDVTVPTNTTLTIERGTQVRFLADTDDIGGGNDTARSELIVEGELIVAAASEVSDGGVAFRSAADTPSNDDWYGIRVASGGTANLSDATIRDGSRCVQNEGGTLTMTNATLSNCGATVTLDATPPSVGQEITATLEDPSVGTITDAQWQRRQRSTDEWTNITSATSPAYEPTTEDIGSQLRATVRYQAETGVYPYAQSAATVPVQAGVPAPPEVTATPLDGAVALTILLTADNGSKVTHLEWRNSHLNGRKLDNRWSGVSGFADHHYPQLFTEGYTHRWPGLQNGLEYGFEVRVRNRQGASAIVSATTTPQAASPVSVSFDSATYEASEGGAAATVGVRLSETANRTLSIPITITAANHAQRDYSVGGLTAGALWFAAGERAQSFTLTAKEDADSDDETVVLSFGSLPARVVADGTMRQATVTLRDNDNPPGTVSLSSSSPQVGSPLTATLTDPSGGIAGTTWQWQRRSSPTASWTSAAGTSAQPRPWISTYTPLAGDGGAPLRATVRYTDADGANQQAESSATEAVRAAAPSVSAPTFAHPTDAFRVEQGQTKQITLDAATGPGITYSLVGAPAWIVPRPGSARVYTLQPASTQAAVPYNFTWLATNAGGSAHQTLTITVTAPPPPPPPPSPPGIEPVVLTVNPLTCYVNEYCSFTFPAARKGTEPITYRVSPPSWATASGRSFSGTAPGSPGTFSASLNASNAYGTDAESLTINVKRRPVAGVAPVLASVSSITCYVGEYCSFTFPAARKGTAPITYRVSPPSWATASGRSFSGTAPSNPGTFSASVNASNAYGTDSESLTINVKRRPVAGVAPVLASVSSITCYVGEYCSFTFPAATSGTAPITYTVSPPSWARSSGSRGFAGTAPSNPGTFSASVNASNAYGTDAESLTINVKRRPVIGDPPVLPAVDPLTCYVNEYCSFTFPAATSGTAPITYRVSPPSWANASGRSFSGTAPSRPGTFSASLNASNAYGPDSESLTIKVKRRPVAGVAPVLPAVDPLTCYVGEYCSFTFPAATSGTAPITYTVSPPSWARSSGS
ncbi:MAG: hypothetical protein OXE49_06990, partial [Gemmatimonadetes bacterium]|nr:hypothetical protein [Gemmatimonadota bacterium]